jgi:zinc transporter 1/2/3
MMGVFSIFYVELIAFRWGTSRLKALGIGHDPHGHGVAGAAHAAHGPEPEQQQVHDASNGAPSDLLSGLEDVEKNVDTNKHDHVHHHGHVNQDHVAAQIIGVGILEFGVVLHSVLIGLTLAVDSQFKTLFVVIIFHRESPSTQMLMAVY